MIVVRSTHILNPARDVYAFFIDGRLGGTPRGRILRHLYDTTDERKRGKAKPYSYAGPPRGGIADKGDNWSEHARTGLCLGAALAANGAALVASDSADSIIRRY
jgi:hypothetical protein